MTTVDAATTTNAEGRQGRNEEMDERLKRVLLYEYPEWKRNFTDVAFVLTFTAWFSHTVCQIVASEVQFFPYYSAYSFMWRCLATIFCLYGGFWLSDFLVALLHWSVDTYGSASTPIIGTTIRNFRAHHLIPQEILKHGLFETNGDNCMAALLIPLIMWYFDIQCKQGIADFQYLFLVFLALGLACTNQFHTWAHRYSHEWPPPFFIEMLIGSRLVLSPYYHVQHHHLAHDTHYGITNGLSDYLWRPLKLATALQWVERVIERVTGIEPRKDDIELHHYYLSTLQQTHSIKVRKDQ